MNSTHFHRVNRSFPPVECNKLSWRERKENSMMESNLPLDMREFWNIVDADYFSIPSKLIFDKVSHFVTCTNGKRHIYIHTYRN